MRRSSDTSSLRMVGAVAGMAIALSGCAANASSQPDPAAPTPVLGGSPTASPEAPAAPSRAPAPEPLPQADDIPPAGLDVRYLDADGNYRVLRVKDFPR